MLSFTTTDNPLDNLLQQVDASLEAHNLAAAPLGDVRPLAVFATTEAGEVVGGAVGRTWGGCCELQQLWVAAGQRGQGVGTRLLQDFEARARTRGCHTFYLTTLSFQAPDFYRRLGYTVLAQIAGYPEGIVKYLMQRLER
ncbi:MAG: GNAT family N-acetyltransferase [Roseateles sp.]